MVSGVVGVVAVALAFIVKRTCGRRGAMLLGMSDPREILVRHAWKRLTHEFGTTRFETWLGKDGLYQHSFEEAAEVVVDSLWALLSRPDVIDAIGELHASGQLAQPPDNPGSGSL